MTFGQLVRALREAEGLTQDEVGALMGLPAAGASVRIARWEADTHVPTRRCCRSWQRVSGTGPSKGAWTCAVRLCSEH